MIGSTMVGNTAAGLQQYRNEIERGREQPEKFREGIAQDRATAEQKLQAEKRRRDSLAGEMRSMRNRLTGMAKEEMGGFADQANARADSMAQRGAAIDRRTEAMDSFGGKAPVYQGISVNPTVAARNLAMGDERKASLAQKGYEVSPEGVVRRMAGGGSSPSDPPASAQGPVAEGTPFEAARALIAHNRSLYEGNDGVPGEVNVSALEEKIKNARSEYALERDNGEKYIPSGADGLIEANDNLSWEERNRKRARLAAYKASKGQNFNRDLQGSPLFNQYYDSYMQERARRKARHDSRDARYARRAMNREAALARAQQQQTMGQIARLAMMGNPEAMQVMNNIQQNNARMQAMAMQNQNAMLDRQSRERLAQAQMQGNMTMAEMEDARTRELAEQRNALLGRQYDIQEAGQESQAEYQKQLLGIRELEAQANMKIADARQKVSEAQTDAEKIRAQAYLKQAEAELELAQARVNEIESKIGKQGQPGNLIDYEEQQAAIDPTASPEDIRTRALAAQSSREITSMAEQGDPTARKIYSIPPSDNDINAMKPQDRVADYVGRIRKFYGPDEIAEMDPSVLAKGMMSQGASLLAIKSAADQATIDVGKGKVLEAGEGVPTLKDLRAQGVISHELYADFAATNAIRRAAGMSEIIPNGQLIQEDRARQGKTPHGNDAGVPANPYAPSHGF